MLPHFWMLHSFDFLSGPRLCSLHVFPSPLGRGLVQVLWLQLTPPPQEAEHFDQLLHSEYPPSIPVS